MGSFFDKIRLGSSLSSLRRALSWFHNATVDVAKETNPLLRMYYDSDLGSPIEGEVEKAFAAASYDTLKKYVPNWKPALNLCKSIGNWIAHKKVQALDVSKVVHHISTDRISTDQAYHELAKRTTTGLFAVGKVACRAAHVIGVLSSKISDTLLPEDINDLIKKGFDLVAGESLRKVRNKIFSKENKERVTHLVEQGFKVAHTATKKIINNVDKALDKTQVFVEKVAKKVGEELKPFKNKVVSTAKTVGNAVKEGAKWVLNKLKFW